MNATKALSQIILATVALAGCADGCHQRGLPSGHVNASPQKVQLETIDSLISSGEHRKALSMLDSFQQRERDDIFLIQSEVLFEQALDSLYGE